MRLSTVEQPVRKEAISAANPKQSLRNIDNNIRGTDSRGKFAACNSQPKPREFVLPLKRMSHLFSNSTDLKAVAVFRAHTRHRHGLALDQTLQESHRQSAEMSQHALAHLHTF